MRRRALLAASMLSNSPDIPDEPTFGIDINNYLTIQTLDSGTNIYFRGNDCEYCIDGDGTWNTLKGGESLYISKKI